MDILGAIRSEPDPPGVDRQRWIDLIRQHPNLATPLPREGINPFTKQPMAIRPKPDDARVIVGGEQVGSMSWAQHGPNEIDVYGEPRAVVPLARNIAELLGGRFEEWRPERTLDSD
jgi:hypothetical protein